MDFIKPDTETFRNLALAYEALDKCGNMPCILNAANEIAVDAFLEDKIKFLQIHNTIKTMMGKHKVIDRPNIEQILEIDTKTKKETREFLECSQ